MNAAKKLVTFVKKETVLCIAGLLAVVSMFIIHPSADYFGYIDYRVLALLFCFMAVVAGFRSVGLFEWLIKKMLCYVKNARQLELVLVLGCFFASMWITNDVALLTFVPFAVAVLQAAGLTENLIFVIVMQTIAANLGSMCTPIGNPQNLYLYSLSGSPVTAFLKLMFPVTAVSLGLLLVTSLCIPKREIKVQAERAILEQGAADRKAAGRAISDRKMSGAEVSDKEEMVRENAKDEKVQNITDIEGFFKVVDSCEGKVELVTGEGDRLNLKSKLSQYVSMANIFSNGEIPELEIVAHEPEDIDKLVKFMLLGSGKED